MSEVLVYVVMPFLVGLAASLLINWSRPWPPAPGLRRCHGCGGAVFRRCPMCHPNGGEA